MHHRSVVKRPFNVALPLKGSDKPVCKVGLCMEHWCSRNVITDSYEATCKGTLLTIPAMAWKLTTVTKQPACRCLFKSPAEHHHPWPVPNYTAWWYSRWMCGHNLHRVATWQKNGLEPNPRPLNNDVTEMIKIRIRRIWISKIQNSYLSNANFNL